MIIGTRAQVFHGNADMTSGGLRKGDLKQDKKDGAIKSKAAVSAAKKRMKKEGKKHLTKVFKPETGEFKPQPKRGTAAHTKLIKKM